MTAVLRQRCRLVVAPVAAHVSPVIISSGWGYSSAGIDSRTWSTKSSALLPASKGSETSVSTKP